MTAGPGAYDVCSSCSALPEKHMESPISEVLTQWSSPGWRWGAIFSHELHIVPLNQWGKCDSHRTQKGVILKLSSFNGLASGTVQHHQEFRGCSDTIGKAARTFKGIKWCHWFDTWEATPESWSNFTQQVCWSLFRFLDQKSQKQSQKPKTGGRAGTQVHALSSWYSLFSFPLAFPPLLPNTKHNLKNEFQSWVSELPSKTMISGLTGGL